MKLFDVLKKVGGTALRIAFPRAGAVIDEVNKFLPDKDRLPDDATGTQMKEAIEKLPPDKQAEIMNRQFDVQIEEIRAFSNDIKTLADVDKAGASTRPQIAIIMAWLTVYGVVVAISAIVYAIVTKALTIENAWPAILAVLATPTSLLLQYFGKRTKEKIARYETGTGNKVTSALFSLFKK